MKSKAPKRRVTVTVRTKRGKTYRRSIEKLAVQIGNQGVRHALKEEHAEKLRSQGVNSQNRILAAVKGIFSRKVNQQAGVLHAMNPGPHGGSSHSWFAERIGAFKQELASREATYNPNDYSGSHISAVQRRVEGTVASGLLAFGSNRTSRSHGPSSDQQYMTSIHRKSFEQTYGAENVSHVPYNPNRWVR
ncbi:MAG: hypothetical protein E6Q97_01500 [Desulfurellales bacterium]|nr:MAG: hypothetical protein E6Q97_01500 [Desulfurellales bacterium]